jgi:hypothetical protein
MSIRWTLPGEAPDPLAIARMRQHFPRSNELMPIPWFMGDITFYDSLATDSPQTLDAKEFCRALGDIASGINSFPDVYYVPVWKAWFKFLLPAIIIRADEAANFNSFDLDLLVKGITAFFNIYPYQIDEEYPGFRDDVVSSLGACALPRKLAREDASQRGDYEPLFNAIWEARRMIENHGLQSFEEVNSSMLFCLKYLTAAEIAEWATSLFQIDSPQWHLQLIFSLSEWFTALKRTGDWNHEEDAFLREILNKSGLLDEFSIPKFNSFDEFIPAENVRIFNQIVAEQFPYEVFRAWADEIWELLDKSSMQYLTLYLKDDLKNLEALLFQSVK